MKKKKKEEEDKEEEEEEGNRSRCRTQMSLGCLRMSCIVNLNERRWCTSAAGRPSSLHLPSPSLPLSVPSPSFTRYHHQPHSPYHSLPSLSSHILLFFPLFICFHSDIHAAPFHASSSSHAYTHAPRTSPVQRTLKADGNARRIPPVKASGRSFYPWTPMITFAKDANCYYLPLTWCLPLRRSSRPLHYVLATTEAN